MVQPGWQGESLDEINLAGLLDLAYSGVLSS